MAVPYKRALVLSGGGAKGVFEAGVLKACHHTGVTFDVLTGSSIPRATWTPERPTAGAAPTRPAACAMCARGYR